MKMRLLTLSLLLAAVAATACAQSAMPGMAPAAPTAPAPVDRALNQSMDAMMTGMNAPPTGDPDRDFAAMMIPHHQGAVAMCKVELQYGRDAQLRQLCTGIIKAQATEIAQMKRWQAAHGD